MPTPKIDRAEFERMLLNLDVPDSAIGPYLRLDPLAGDRFRPTAVPNLDLVDFGSDVEREAAGALSMLNNLARWRRRKRYERKIQNGWSGIRAAAEGVAPPPKIRFASTLEALPQPRIGEIEAAALIAAEEAALLEEIGRREAILSVSPDAAAEFSAESPISDGLPRFRDRGLAVVDRLERELFALLCGTDAEDRQERETLRAALGLSEAAAIGAVATALIGLECPPFIAPLAAAAVVKRGIDPAWDETCAFWRLRLEPS